MIKYIGEDKSGRPLILMELCGLDMSKFEDDTAYKDYFVAMFELEFAKHFKGKVDSFTLIMDPRHPDVSKFKMNLLLQSIANNLKHCPERMSKITVLNANWVVWYFYKFVKPFLTKRTEQKITIHGEEPNKILEDLKTDIPINVIPKKFGGKGK